MQGGRWNLVKRIQYLLTNSFYAKALVVKKVAENKGKKTARVDKELWTTKKQKYQAAMELNFKDYKAKPTRRVFIKKSNGKLRPLDGLEHEIARNYFLTKKAGSAITKDITRTI